MAGLASYLVNLLMHQQYRCGGCCSSGWKQHSTCKKQDDCGSVPNETRGTFAIAKGHAHIAWLVWRGSLNQHQPHRSSMPGHSLCFEDWQKMSKTGWKEQISILDWFLDPCLCSLLLDSPAYLTFPIRTPTLYMNTSGITQTEPRYRPPVTEAVYSASDLFQSAWVPQLVGRNSRVDD